MTKQDLYDAIGLLDDAYCRQALQKPEKKHSAPGRMLRVTSAAAAAAVFVCVAGVSVWFAGSLHTESSFQTGDTAETEAPGYTEESECEEQPTAYGELELHRCFDERNPEDAEWLKNALDSQEPLLPIDRAPYIAKFMEPAGDPQAAEAKFTELNTLEYKSYVYHMMLNSVDYYRTAQGTVSVEEAVAEKSYEFAFQADLMSQQFYENFSFHAADGTTGERYIADGIEYLCGESQVCSESPVEPAEPHRIPDNARGYLNAEGTLLAVERHDTVDQMRASMILHPQKYAVYELWDFETWEITDTPVYLERDAIGIQGEDFSAVIDLQTGIVLRWEWDYGDGSTETLAVTSLEINTDIAVQLHESTEAISSGGAVSLHECWDEREHPEWIESARSNKQPIPPVDTAPYIAKFMESAENLDAKFAALNTLEYKSYVYHMMLNSVDYYKTAQGSVRLVMPDGSIDYEVDFQADLRSEQCYEKQLIYTDGVNSPLADETYIADGRRISCAESRVYDERDAEPLLPNCVTDNARCYRVTDDSCFFDRRSNPVKGLFVNFVLLPDDYAMTCLWDFDKWEIIDTCVYLRRHAVIIQGEDFMAAIDLETGMLLRTDAGFADGIQTIEVTRLEVDNDIAVKQFDQDAYTMDE